jgi:ParB family chromosome partitioning protein
MKPAGEPSARPDEILREIAIDRITPNRFQPRTEFRDQGLEELAASIRQKGIIQPVVVRARGDGGFELVAGERRWRAARLAGLATVPGLVRQVGDEEALEMALIENLQREDLGPLERAAAYRRYLDEFRGSVERLADRLGESRASIANYLRFLKLPDEVKDLIRTGQLGMGQARAVAGIGDSQRQLALARLAARRNLSVRQVEDLAREDVPEVGGGGPAGAPSGRDRHFADVEKQLSRSLGMTVRLVAGRKKNSGRIVIPYSSLDEFDRIAQRLGANVGE